MNKISISSDLEKNIETIFTKYVTNVVCVPHNK